MSDIVTGDFNYGSVDEDTAAKLEYFAKSGKALIRKSQIQFIADMGKLLSEAGSAFTQRRRDVHQMGDIGIRYLFQNGLQLH